MNTESTEHSDLIHTLGKLKSAQRSVERVTGLGTVKQNLQYVIDDVEQEIKLIKEKEL